MSFDELLYDLYYNKHNYDGSRKLYLKARLINKNIKEKDVQNWLTKQASYQVNYSKVEKKEYLPIYTQVPHSYQVDLTFLPQYKQQNNKNYVLFTAIGVNTRYAYASYATNKKKETILALFKAFDSDFEINHISGDLGSEFTNKSFIKYLEDIRLNIIFSSQIVISWG